MTGWKSCYYCGKPVRGRNKEHVPPRIMFAPFSNDSITVPSCKRHNQDRSTDDQTMVYALLIPLRNMMAKGRQIEKPDVVKAVDYARPNLDQVRRRAFSASFLTTPPRSLKDMPETSYVTNQRAMEDWVRKITAGLVYHAVGDYDRVISWDRSIVWLFDWLASASSAGLKFRDAMWILSNKEDLRSELDRLSWLEGWSAYPNAYPEDIYSFWLTVRTRDAVIWHRFYNSFNFYVQFSASSSTLASLREKAEWWQVVKTQPKNP